VVAGSRRAATTRQIEVALSTLGSGLVEIDPLWLEGAMRQALSAAGRHLDDGRDVIVTIALAPYLPEESQAVAAALGSLAAEVAKGRPLSGLVLTGGAIAFATCQALGIVTLEIEGEVAPGIPAGVVVGGEREGMRLVTKAGGFGEEDALLKAIEYLRGGRHG